MDAVAEREGFAIVYPDGLQRGWNDGRQDQLRLRGAADQTDDVAFLKVMVQNLIRQGLADRERIYLTGASNGGMMSLRMGCEAAELFAGIAPVIANLPTDIAGSCKPRRPTPMLMINGTADPLVPWGGGGVGFGGRRGNVLSTEETIAIWRRANAAPKMRHPQNCRPNRTSTSHARRSCSIRIAVREHR
jgi:polyhydroxybutyrate depolymerase